MPATPGAALGPQSSGGPGWTYSGGRYGGGSHWTSFAPTSGLARVNPGGPMIAVSGTASGPNAQAKTDLEKLQSDTQAIEAQSQVTVAELTAYAADLKAISPPTGQPSSAVTTAFQTLQSDQSAVLASGTFTNAQQTQIVNDVAAVLTSEGATAAQASKASTDLQTIITASGLASSDVAQIDSDLKAVQTDLGVPVATTASSSTTTTSSTATSGSTSSSTTPPPPLPGPMNFGGGLILNMVMGQGSFGPMIMGIGGPADVGIASPMIVRSGDPIPMGIGGPMYVKAGGGLGLFAPPAPPSTGGSSPTGGSTTS
jgi:hypothetical protein